MEEVLLPRYKACFFFPFGHFLQPIFSYLIIYGPDFFKAFGYLLKRITKYTGAGSDSVLFVLATVVLIKFALAAMVPFLLRYLNRNGWEKYETLIRKRSGPNPIMKGFRYKNTSAVRGAIKDLLTPAFLISLVIMGSFFFISEEDSVKARVESPAFSRNCLRFFLCNSSTMVSKWSAMACPQKLFC